MCLPQGVDKMNACSQCAVRESAICHALSGDQLDDLSRLGRRQSLKRGQALQWQGDESLLVGNVIGGALKLCASTPEGREQTLGILLQSDFIGRPFGKTAMLSVVALTDSEVCTFARSSFDAFTRHHPALEHGLLERTLSDLDRAREWMMLLARKTAGERIAIFLLNMAERSADAEEEDRASEFELPVSRQDIADLLGLTIETVSRQLTLLRDAGVISTPGRRTIQVNDFSALEARTGESF